MGVLTGPSTNLPRGEGRTVDVESSKILFLVSTDTWRFRVVGGATVFTLTGAPPSLMNLGSLGR